MQGYCDVCKWTILKRTSPEVKCLHPTSSRREMCTLSVSYVIYHKFSRGAAFYTLNGKNENVMLEYNINAMRQFACFVVNPITLCSSLIAHWMSCTRRNETSCFSYLGLDLDDSSVSWLFGVQLVVFFCSGI